MDSPDPRSGVKYLVAVLRRITRIVQIAPFVYLLLLAVYLLGESFLPGWILGLIDNVLDTPVYTTAGLLFFGRLLKLCSWFRTACLLPFTTKIECYIDSFVFSFTQNEIVFINVATAIIILAFIYLAFRHFFHGRKTTPHRNPGLLQVQG